MRSVSRNETGPIISAKNGTEQQRGDEKEWGLLFFFNFPGTNLNCYVSILLLIVKSCELQGVIG